jgi:protein phosphatase
MKARFAAKSDVGMKRQHNEDFYALIDDEQLFIVADGMGGHASGEIASKMAAETISEFYRHTKDADATWPYKMDRQLSYVENRLVCGIRLANKRIYEASSTDARFKGMGTTVVTGLVSGDKLFVAHVGDSRCYRVRSGQIQQITRDHSLLEDYKEAKPDITEEELKNFPHKNVITRALGMRDSVQVDIRQHDAQAGDVYVLCSDGLSGMVENGIILQIVQHGAPDLQKAANELIDTANRNGGVDNVTAVLFQTVAG